MRHLLGWLLAGVAIAGMTAPAMAVCNVVALPPVEHVAHAHAIFEGEVLRVRPAPRPSGVVRMAATFKVVEAYKGVRVGSEVMVGLDSSDCGIIVTPGERRTVFVDGWLGTNIYNKVSVGGFSDPAHKSEYDRLLHPAAQPTTQ